jgi:hypothetical protein
MRRSVGREEVAVPSLAIEWEVNIDVPTHATMASVTPDFKIIKLGDSSSERFVAHGSPARIADAPACAGGMERIIGKSADMNRLTAERSADTALVCARMSSQREANQVH